MPNWGSYLLIVFGTVGLLTSIYLRPTKVDVRSILNKQMLRWEAPVFIGMGIALALYPMDVIIIPALTACFLASGIGIWMGMREVAERKNRGESLGDE